MNRFVPLILLSAGILAFATVFLVIVPAAEIRTINAPEGLAPYTEAELRGRAHYVDLGCVYCHSQQPRSPAQGPDVQRGWGRASTAADYVYDAPHLLGTMRTGPDLLNIGARMPSRAWHLTHLYQPRAISPTSIMPGFPFLFETKTEAEDGDVEVQVPEGMRPDGEVVVARQSALDLVDYLLSLDRTYPGNEPTLRDNGFVESEETSG